MYWYPPGQEMRLAVGQHLRALEGRGHELIYHNAFEPPSAWLRWVRPDAVVLHTTFLCLRWAEEFPRKRGEYAWLGRLRCPKLALPQDEYDHSEVLEEWLEELGATTVFSCFDAEQRAILYPRLGKRATFVRALTGYVDERAAHQLAGRQPAPAERPFDLVYRATQLPYWFGSHGQLKHRIAEVAQERAQELALRTDISTSWEKTIFGERWLDFVMSGRAIIGVESGSSVLDRRGEIQRRIRSLLAAEPDLSFEEVDARMPAGWDAYAFFAISPRHLEAVVTKTCQILVEGSYDGILEPNVHFIPVRRDLSDLGAALERIRDVAAAAEIAQRAYDDVCLSGRYTLARFADGLEAAVGPPQPARRPPLPLLLRGAAPLERAARAPIRVIRPDAPPSERRVQANVLFLFARAVLTNRALRQLTLHAVGTRPRPPLRHLVGDIVRLAILRRVLTASTPPAQDWSVATERSNGVLVFRSGHAPQSADDSAQADPAAVGGIAWDHSAVASVIPLVAGAAGWGVIPLGPHGRYEFTTVAGSSELRREALRAVGVDPAPQGRGGK